MPSVLENCLRRNAAVAKNQLLDSEELSSYLLMIVTGTANVSSAIVALLLSSDADFSQMEPKYYAQTAAALEYTNPKPSAFGKKISEKNPAIPMEASFQVHSFGNISGYYYMIVNYCQLE